MTRQTLASKQLIIVHEEVTQLKKDLLKGRDCVLLADGWKNKSANKKYIVFAISNMYVPTAFIAFKDISQDTEDGLTLSRIFNEAVTYAKDTYNCNVYAVVTDNDSKIKCGARLAKSNDDKPLIQSTCFSHSGCLLSKSLIPEDVMRPIREIVTFFRDPKFHTELKNRKGTTLKNFPDTRFCFARDTCESLLKNINILREISRATNFDIPVEIIQNLHDLNFEERLRDIIKLLTPLCKIINKCQDPRYSIAEATQFWLELRLPIEDYELEERAQIEAILGERLARAIHPSAFAANILHPQYRGALLNESQRASALNFFREHLDAQQMRELNDYLHPDVRLQHDVFFNHYAENCSSPVSFWTLCRMSLTPSLSDFAVNLMLIPSSTAQLEGIFSQWKLIHSKLRASLKDDTSAYLIDIYHSMKYMNLQEGKFKEHIKKTAKRYLECE